MALALTHSVDTSVFTRLARPEVRGALEPRAERGELARAEISDLEVGYSARSASEWDRLTAALGVFELVATTSEHVRRAKQVQRLLAANDQRGRKVPNLLIAAAAESESQIVLRYDADFDRIAAVTGQRSEWIVPAGSID